MKLPPRHDWGSGAFVYNALSRIQFSKQPRRFKCKTVIASAAKQSVLPLRGKMDCFAALAMTLKHAFTPSPRDAPEALLHLLPKEGVGNAGCPLHPRPRVHLYW